MGHYLKYAIGEIVLVVIGILIALQINNWNANRLTLKKGQDYLKEIKQNLTSDSKNLNFVIRFNESKIKAIDSTFSLFANEKNQDNYLDKIEKFGNALFQYQLFLTTRSAFDNMLSSEKIDIIKNRELRESITQYYNDPGVEGTQERVKEVTRTLVDNMLPKAIHNTAFQKVGGFNIDITSPGNVAIHNDRTIISTLMILKLNTMMQSNDLADKLKQIEKMTKLIDQELSD